ncbi:MAG TPA: DUF4350 domain-containing protein [Mucilaginibacter sp.]|jgi:hypothetical protein
MRDFKIFLSIACILLLVYLVAQYNKPAPVNWKPTLYYNDKIPYGTYIIYHQLNSLFPGARVIKTNTSVFHTLHDSISVPGNYIVIAKTVDLGKNDFNELVKYLKAGNSVFISSFTFKGFLADTLKIALNYEYKKGNAGLNFTNKQLKQPTDYTFNKDISNQYFEDFDTAKAIVIGKNSYGHSTYLNFKFGKGNLFICPNPAVFSNYNMLNKQGADYAAKALSYLPVTNNLYWDEFQNGDMSEDMSPLRVFFEHPNLEWAYYLSLFGILIFVLYEMKRRQRIIPVIEPLQNSTLNFVKVVGQVYYEKRDNINIAHKKILYLFTYLRDEYQIKTNTLDNEFIEKLISKLGIESTLANELIGYIKYISVQSVVNDKELIELNKLIEQFYIKSR